MFSNVGPHRYEVIISDSIEPEHLGEARHQDRQILIHPRVRPENRLEVLLHELYHCWLFHFPKARTEEEAAQLHASMTMAAMDDLQRQGGLPALCRLGACPVVTEEPEFVSIEDEMPPEEPEDEEWLKPHQAPLSHIHLSQCVARSNAERCACQQCGMTVAGGSVTTSPARYDAECHGFIVERRLYCGHCDHVMIWKEGATPEGHPNGSLVGEPEYRRGMAVEEFLNQHPEAAVVMS